MTSYHARAGQRIAGEFLPGISSGSAHDSETRLVLNQEERDRKARMLERQRRRSITKGTSTES